MRCLLLTQSRHRCCGKFGASAAYSCCACQPNRRGLASAYPKITSMFYVHAEVVRPQKSRRATDNFPRSDWDVPPFRGTECGDEGEGGIDLHCRFGAQRRPSKKTARMGDKAKPSASLADGFAV